MKKVGVLLVIIAACSLFAMELDEVSIMTGGNTVGFVPGVPMTSMNPAWMVNTNKWVFDVNISNLWDFGGSSVSWFELSVIQPYKDGFAGYISFSRSLESVVEEQAFSYALAGYINSSTSYGLELSWLRFTDGATPVDALNVSFGIRGTAGDVTAYNIFVKDFTTWTSRGVADIGQTGVGIELLLPLTLGMEFGVRRSDIWYLGLTTGFDIGKIFYARGGTSLNLSISNPQRSDLLLGGGFELLIDNFSLSLGILGNILQGSAGSTLGMDVVFTISANALW
ncbi:MAG: hypothetical protein PWP09_1629 [Thermotogota bacterium]|nr:hypothetical protein [Thermotogota bacterium]